jgi:hypothetical protein
MSTFIFLARLTLAAVLAVAAVFKLADRHGTQRTLTELRLPASLTGPVALAIPLAELALAAALIPNVTARWGALGAVAMLALFSIGISFALLLGRRPDCGCFGALHSSPLSWRLVLRNLALAGLGGLVFWSPASPAAPSGREALVLAGAFLVTVVFGGQAWFSWQLFRQNGRLLARVEVLEQDGLGAGEQLARAGIPVGTDVPKIDTSTSGGDRIGLHSLLADGRSLLLVFTDPTCGACESVVDSLASRSETDAERVSVALVTPERSAPSHLLDTTITVLLDHERQLSHAFRIPGVPAAVLIGPDARTASELAVGQEAIEALMDETRGSRTGTLRIIKPVTATGDERVAVIR